MPVLFPSANMWEYWAPGYSRIFQGWSSCQWTYSCRKRAAPECNGKCIHSSHVFGGPSVFVTFYEVLTGDVQVVVLATQMVHVEPITKMSTSPNYKDSGKTNLIGESI